MKKVLIFVFVAFIALASTGCASPMFTAKKDSSSDIKWLQKNEYVLDLAFGGDAQKAMTKAYEMAQNDNKVLLIGRCDKAYSVGAAIKCAKMDAMSEYSKAKNSNIVGVEKINGSKDSDVRYSYEYISETNARLNSQNFQVVAVFKRDAQEVRRMRNKNNSAIVFCICDK